MFSDISLNRIACDFDLIARKFRFFRDYRSLADGGQPVDPTGNTTYAFNIDWRISNNENRPIQLNMGWILGYRQQYYRWQDDYVDSSGVSFNRLEGYSPEAIYDTLGTKYYILSIARLEPENNLEMMFDAYINSNIKIPYYVVGIHLTRYGDFLKDKYLNKGICLLTKSMCVFITIYCLYQKN